MSGPNPAGRLRQLEQERAGMPLRRSRREPSSWLSMLLPALLLCLSACGPAAEGGQKLPEPVSAGITGLNHTTTFIASFYVDGAWGGNISSVLDGGGGGSTTCCVKLPYRYRAGLQAKVRWNHTNTATDHWKEAVAVVDPYPDGAGHAWVHFFPDDSVRVIVSNLDPGHPKYPGPDPLKTMHELEQKGSAP